MLRPCWGRDDFRPLKLSSLGARQNLNPKQVLPGPERNQFQKPKIVTAPAWPQNLKQRSHIFKLLYITQLSYKRMFHFYRASAVKFHSHFAWSIVQQADFSEFQSLLKLTATKCQNVLAKISKSQPTTQNYHEITMYTHYIQIYFEISALQRNRVVFNSHCKLKFTGRISAKSVPQFQSHFAQSIEQRADSSEFLPGQHTRVIAIAAVQLQQRLPRARSV